MNNMSLLKAYLLKTDDPFVMIKCWYEDLTNTIWKANENPAKESYEDILQHIFREQGRAGGFSYKDPETNRNRTLNQSTLTASLDKILSIKEVSEFLSSKSVAGDKPQSKKNLGWLRTDSGMKSTFQMNLMKIKEELRPYAKQPEYAQHINRIFAAIDKQVTALPKTPREIAGFRATASDYDKVSNDKDFEKKMKPYKKLLEQLQDIQKINHHLDKGNVDASGKVAYPSEAIKALDKLFDNGPSVIFQLDEFAEAAEGDTKDSLGARFANSGIENAREAREIEDDIAEILRSDVKIMKLKGGLETMELLEALQNHLYPQFTGKTAFRNRGEAKNIMDNVKRARKRRMRQKKDKAKRMGNFDTSQSAKDERFNDRVKSAERSLTRMYYLLGLKEDKLRGRKLATLQEEVRDNENAIRRIKREMADRKPSDEKLGTKFERKFYKAFDDMPDKEEHMAKGRAKAQEYAEMDAQRAEEAESQLQEEIEQENERAFEELMAGGTFTRGFGE